jgi:hypothetical protein
MKLYIYNSYSRGVRIGQRFHKIAIEIEEVEEESDWNNEIHIGWSNSSYLIAIAILNK